MVIIDGLDLEKSLCCLLNRDYWCVEYWDCIFGDLVLCLVR